MLYLDGISLSKLKDELKETLVGKRITKVFQYNPLTLSLFLGKSNFYISAVPNLPICYIATQKESAPDKPMNFSLSLRKYLVGAVLTNITQYGFDRILLLSFEKINELGVKQKVKLIIEIMGKHSNIILVDENFIILDLLKKFSIEENKLRLLMNGAKYEYPVITPKKSPQALKEEEFNHYKLDNQLIKNVDGIGKLAAEHLYDFKAFKSIISNPPSPTIYRKGEIIKYGTVFYLPLKGYETTCYDSINEMINTYILETLNSQQFSDSKKILNKVVEKEIKKNKKILKHVKKDIEKYSEFEKYKKIGDILAANLYSLKGYEESIKLFDFYNNQYINIKLNPQRSPNENLNNYYNLYNKQKRGLNHSKIRVEKIEEELIYLENLHSFISIADDKKTLEGISNELTANKYIKENIKNTRGKNKKKITKITPTSVEIDGLTGYFGKNNIENDYVTFKVAHSQDTWFHSKNIPGAHFILKEDIENIPTNTITTIAKIVANHSKVSSGQSVQVDYCSKKHVKKIKGGKLGFVTYSHEKSILVRKD